MVVNGVVFLKKALCARKSIGDALASCCYLLDRKACAAGTGTALHRQPTATQYHQYSIGLAASHINELLMDGMKRTRIRYSSTEQDLLVEAY